MKKIEGIIIERFKNSGKKKLKKIILFLVFICLGYLILIISLYAAVPQRINYQGKLLDSAGDPVSDGNRNITFRIFNVSVGGGALWSETQSVNTQDGLFNVILGSVSSISLDFNQDYWLEVQVSGDGAMTPRHRLVSVPYSFRAEDANNSEQLNSQSAGYYLNASNINAGTLSDLRLSANVTRLGSNIDASEITTNIVSSIDGVTNDGGNINLIAGTNMTITPNDTTNTITFSASGSGDNLGNHIATQNLRLNGNYLSGDGGNEGIFVASDGKVGIGTASPFRALDIIGDGTWAMRVTSGIAAFDEAVMIADSGWEPDLNISGTMDVSKEVCLAIYSGNVGIGTTTPSRKLFVNGDAGGTTAWSNDSHSSYKEKFKNVTVLDKIKSLNIMEWQYKKEHCPQDTYRHLGPFAEDFRDKFGLGKSDYNVQSADIAGVALKAIQEQQIIIEELRKEISLLKKGMKQLEKKIN